MASIIGSDILDDNNYVLRIKVTISEMKKLEGNVHDIHLVCCNNMHVPSTIYSRGKDGNTKYFLIPKTLRNDTTLSNKVFCIKTEIENKILWTYIMDKITFKK